MDLTSWILFAATAMLAIVGVSASGAASASPPGAIFCAFNCSAGARPTRPGSCLVPEEVYRTGGQSWLMLKTREDTPAPGQAYPYYTLEWSKLSAGNMSWEGWFRVIAPPSQDTSLMGTYGALHDTQTWVLNGEASLGPGSSGPSSWSPGTRRRHGALFIDRHGFLSLTTNAGQSTGRIDGPNVSDAQWHHIAVVWQSSIGGHRIDLKFKVWYADLQVIPTIPGLQQDLINIITTTLAAQAKVSTDHVFLVLYDDSNRQKNGYIRFGVNATINPPLDRDITDSVRRLRNRADLILELSTLIRARIMQIGTNSPGFPVKLPFDPPISVDFMTFAAIVDAGTVLLYVDGLNQPGTLTYAPGMDNIASDQQLVIAGGLLGRPLHAELQRFRFWNVSLSPADLELVSRCKIPTVSSLFGGPWPHSLMADYPLNGNFSNVEGTDFKSLNNTNTRTNVTFVRGGVCHYGQCPALSEDGCPLNRELKFNTSSGCESFARFTFCRTASPNRQRPPYVPVLLVFVTQNTF